MPKTPDLSIAETAARRTGKKLFTLRVFDDRRFALTFEKLDAETFRYAHELVSAFPDRKFNRALQVWLVPWSESNLDYLAATFRGDEYELDDNADVVYTYHMKSRRVLSTRQERRWRYLFEDEVPDVPFKFATVPYKHQLVGTDALHGQEFFGVLFETGTGKTKVMIDELKWSADEKVAEGKGALKALVVCPKSVRSTWLYELDKHLPKKYCMFATRLRGGIAGIQDLLEGVRADVPLKIWIASYDILRGHQDQLKKMGFDAMILDESTYIKNPSTQRCKVCWAIGETALRRFILTGTPVANTILDLWAQFEFLRPGILGYDSFRSFKFYYADVAKTGEGFDKIMGYQNLDTLKERMAKCSFVVRKKDCLDLPPKSYVTRSVEMSPAQRQFYNAMRDEFVACLDEDFAEENTSSAQIVLTQFLRLSQICSGYTKSDTGKVIDIPGGDVKLEALGDLVDSIDPGNRIILWARFHYDVDQISAYFKSKGIRYCLFTGRQSEKKRDLALEKFASDDDDAPRVFIGEPGSGGMGVTLLGTEAHPVTDTIYYNNDFSLIKRIQSEDRCHRIGLRNPITYHDIVVEDSIEETIVEILQNKRDISEYMKDYGSIRKILLGQPE